MESLSLQVPLRSNTRRRQTRARLGVPRPFLKWAGGKAQLLAQYEPYFPPVIKGTYHEPFLGGGAVYFHLRPPKAILSDSNAELIHCYKIIKSKPRPLIRSLGRHENSEVHYYRIRRQAPARLDSVERAGRTIYLNKTCYNGLFRVNRSGQFNVPFGRYKNPRFCEKDNILAVSGQLKAATLVVAPFQSVVDRVRAGDLVYLDPPYHPLSTTANFTAYTRDSFGERDQRQLAGVVAELSRKGCQVMLSNSDAPLIHELYREFTRIRVEAKRAINSIASRRGKIGELLILNC